MNIDTTPHDIFSFKRFRGDIIIVIELLRHAMINYNRYGIKRTFLLHLAMYL